MRKPAFPYAKTKAHLSCVVNVQLISAFVFAKIDNTIPLLTNPKFQDSGIFCGCTDCFVSDLVRNPKDRFSHDMDQI